MNILKNFIKEFNLTFHGEAKAYINKDKLYIAVGSKTLMIRLPYVIGAMGEGTMYQ